MIVNPINAINNQSNLFNFFIISGTEIGVQLDCFAPIA